MGGVNKESLRILGNRLNAIVARQQEERNALRTDYLDRCGPALGPAVFEYAVRVPESREAIAHERLIFAEAAIQTLVSQSPQEGAAQLVAILEASEARGVGTYKRFEAATLPYGSKSLLSEPPIDVERADPPEQQ